MILLTGATGMLGANFAFQLLKNNEKIRAIKRQSSKTENVLSIFELYLEKKEAKKLFDKIEWFDGDILDYESIWFALEDITEVYHCAAIVSFNPADRQKIIDTNTQGTANMVNASLERKVKKFCHISSIASLGQEIFGEISEKSERSNDLHYTGYQQSKYMSELEVWRAAEEGLNVVVVNPSIVLGVSPNLQEGSTSLFFNIAKGMKFYTEGITGYVDVEDVVNISIKLMQKEIFGERFILNAENLSYKQVFDMLAEALGKPKPLKKATKFMLNFAWRGAKLASFFSGKPPVITKNIVKSAESVERYSNKKISDLLNHKFIPIKKSIEKNSSFYLKLAKN